MTAIYNLNLPCRRVAGKGGLMKTDSKEFLELMAKWSREAYGEEMESAEDEYYANEDMHGRLPERGTK